MRRVLGVFAIAVVSLVAATAFAQGSTDDARTRMAQGEALFAADNFEAALAEFEQAYGELEGNPSRYLLLFNIGQCYERTFRYDRALSYYRRYLDEGGPEADGRAEVEATIHALEGLLATIELSVNVPEAEVWVDGLRLGTAPGTVLVAGGLHRVELRAEGHVPRMQEIQAAARQTVSASFELEAVSHYRGIDQGVFWVTAGVAVATLGTALGFGISAFVDANAVNAGPENMRTIEDEARVADRALVADVLYGVGGAIAIAAVVLAFVTDFGGAPADAATPSVSVAPLVGPSACGILVQGSL